MQIHAKHGTILVDDADFDIVNGYHWYSFRSGGTFYAKGYLRSALDKNKKIYLHVLLNGQVGIDHINGNGLDNRRSNMRVANKSQNAANAVKGSNRTSKYKGVCYVKRRDKWEAKITKDYKRTHLGSNFESETDAALAYNRAALELFGEFALLNQV